MTRPAPAAAEAEPVRQPIAHPPEEQPRSEPRSRPQRTTLRNRPSPAATRTHPPKWKIRCRRCGSGGDDCESGRSVERPGGLALYTACRPLSGGLAYERGAGLRGLALVWLEGGTNAWQL